MLVLCKVVEGCFYIYIKEEEIHWTLLVQLAQSIKYSEHGLNISKWYSIWF